jgi:hypothetical protein
MEGGQPVVACGVRGGAAAVGPSLRARLLGSLLILIEGGLPSNYSAWSPELPGCVATGDCKEWRSRATRCQILTSSARRRPLRSTELSDCKTCDLSLDVTAESIAEVYERRNAVTGLGMIRASSVAPGAVRAPLRRATRGQLRRTRTEARSLPDSASSTTYFARPVEGLPLLAERGRRRLSTGGSLSA